MPHSFGIGSSERYSILDELDAELRATFRIGFPTSGESDGQTMRVLVRSETEAFRLLVGILVLGAVSVLIVPVRHVVIDHDQRVASERG